MRLDPATLPISPINSQNENEIKLNSGWITESIFLFVCEYMLPFAKAIRKAPIGTISGTFDKPMPIPTTEKPRKNNGWMRGSK